MGTEWPWTSLRRTLRLAAVALSLVLVPLLPCLASRGDESALFRSCFRQCLDIDANQGRNSTAVHGMVPACRGPDDSGGQLPVLWDCDGECKYRCMWKIETERSGRAQTDFGKWPFARLGPMQEPASVALSLANLAANAHCLLRLLSMLGLLDVPRASRASIASENSRAGCGIGKGTKQSRGPERRRINSMVLLWVVHFTLAVNAWTWSSVRFSWHCRPN